MLDLPSDLYRPVATLLYTLLCVAMGIIAYFLRDIRQSVKEKTAGAGSEDRRHPEGSQRHQGNPAPALRLT
ncbi:hypothetical protein G7K71_08560 [Desulfofundulus sp. TPOSR]|uniref:hypothetical protein n=1 Tax=Desulfofundulus sp. TPOSR TaxID=2714340 RepID=UPI00140D355B|nr:hypothetical protein [Desulfofundulus sp. TPOSR]NHM27035.1 hypothetical protein [Desulfofundulus sp. TPOSR]